MIVKKSPSGPSSVGFTVAVTDGVGISTLTVTGPGLTPVTSRPTVALPNSETAPV